MYTTIHLLFDPFINFGFMRRAIVACCALSISITLIGGFLMLRRMSLVGDALSHAILPGVVIGYVFSGVSLTVMNVGGFISGLIVAILSVWVSEKTSLQKDASFSGFCLGFLAFGVVLMSLYGSDVDLLGLLFGSVFSISIFSVKFIGVISTITLISLAFFYRILIFEAFDPDFLRSNDFILLKVIQIFFLLIVVLNLMASFQITGTLMSIGLMMLPNLTARCWVPGLINMLLLSVCIALLCSWIGLLGSFYMFLPAGPTIVLCNSIFFLVSILFGKNQGVLFSVCRK
ncbi:manganese transport system permease protein [Candidatus Blochmanniella floridana]|uniref:Manganese transport system permease protein n=1 Tax=Blochmanniella floridana TaxID=203907 RepID=Q7VQS5_BLOFL|nr:manganese transport system permease protein [Candidatus Blochmannia floridanus]